jgi:hypothetical protein
MWRHYLSMDWRDALFVHWPVQPEIVDARLPAGLEARTHDGSAWLGVIAFLMADIRPRGVPRALGLTFGEVNLRTYVVGPDGGKGIYFYNLDANDPLGVPVARWFYQLPYYRATMNIERCGELPESGRAGTDAVRTVKFVSHRIHRGVADAYIDATYGPLGEPFRPDEGTLPNFLVENYRFYLAGSDVGGGAEAGSNRELFYGDVRHPPWDLYEADLDLRSTNLLEANGFERPDAAPLAQYSPGVPVEADRIRKLD